ITRRTGDGELQPCEHVGAGKPCPCRLRDLVGAPLPSSRSPLPGQPTVVGKQGGYTETRSPVNGMTTDGSACGRKPRVAQGHRCVRMVGRTSRMLETSTSGSVGALGEQPPRVTRQRSLIRIIHGLRYWKRTKKCKARRPVGLRALAGVFKGVQSAREQTA